MKSEIYKLSELRKMNQLDGNKELIFVNQLNKRIELLKLNIFEDYWDEFFPNARKQDDFMRKIQEHVGKIFEVEK